MSVFIKNNETLETVVKLLKDVEAILGAESAVTFLNHGLKFNLLKEAAKLEFNIYYELDKNSKIDVNNAFDDFCEEYFDFKEMTLDEFKNEKFCWEFIFKNKGILDSFIYGGAWVEYHLHNKKTWEDD